MSAVHSVVHLRCTYSTDLPLTARIDILEASPFTLWETSIIGQRLRHGRDSIGIGTQTATSAQVLKWQMLEWFHQGEPEVESKVVDEAFRKKKIYRVHQYTVYLHLSMFLWMGSTASRRNDWFQPAFHTSIHMATSGPPQVPIRFAQSGKLPRSWQWQSVDLDVVHVVSRGVVFWGSWRILDPFQVIIVEWNNMNEPLMN